MTLPIALGPVPPPAVNVRVDDDACGRKTLTYRSCRVHGLACLMTKLLESGQMMSAGAHGPSQVKDPRNCDDRLKNRRMSVTST